MRFIHLSVCVGLTSAACFGAEVPRCWTSDQAPQTVQDGVFKIQVSTQGRSAQDLALVLLNLQSSMLTQKGVGTHLDLTTVEIDMSSPATSDWRPSAAYPTLDAWKAAVIAGLVPIAQLPGVSVQCVLEVPRRPYGI